MRHRAYYNEIEPFAAAWLRNLISADLIAPGDVDERSIVDVRPDDLRGYNQCHFFAGIGGWSYAARLAGWPDDRPVWTGSCPCQPLSKAGKRRGANDDRHLWPIWKGLIEECRPDTLFGEQVSVGIARSWFDAVSDDFEEMDYACGAIVAPSACCGAEHIRDRLWFVAHSSRPGPPRPVQNREGSPRLVQPQEFQRGCLGLSPGVLTGTDRASVLPIDGTARCVDAVHAFGNAIDSRPASQFIAAFLDFEASLSYQRKAA